jgi:hypothetical protein
LPTDRSASAPDDEGRSRATDLAPDRGGVKGRIAELVELLLGPDATPADQLRARMALFSVNMAGFAAQDLAIPDPGILAVARQVAQDLMPEGED